MAGVGSWKQDFEFEVACGLHWPLRSQSWKEWMVLAVWDLDRWSGPGVEDSAAEGAELPEPAAAQAAVEGAAFETLVREALEAGLAVDPESQSPAPRPTRPLYGAAGRTAYTWVRAGLLAGQPPSHLLAPDDARPPLEKLSESQRGLFGLAVTGPDAGWASAVLGVLGLIVLVSLVVRALTSLGG